MGRCGVGWVVRSGWGVVGCGWVGSDGWARVELCIWNMHCDVGWGGVGRI